MRGNGIEQWESKTTANNEHGELLCLADLGKRKGRVESDPGRSRCAPAGTDVRVDWGVQMAR